MISLVFFCTLNKGMKNNGKVKLFKQKIMVITYNLTKFIN